MIDAGMNVARLDFSQGDHKSNGALVQNLQAGLKQRPDKIVAVVLETKGPEIRTGVNKDGKDIELVAGQSLEIFTDTAIESDDTKITCNYKNLPATVSIGSTVIVGEGLLTLEVTEVSDVSQTLILAVERNLFKLNDRFESIITLTVSLLFCSNPLSARSLTIAELVSARS